MKSGERNRDPKGREGAVEVPSLPSGAMGSPGLDLTAATSRARAGDKRAIDAVASGFESLFVSLLIKQMRQSLEPETMFSHDKSDILGGLFDHYMGQHLA